MKGYTPGHLQAHKYALQLNSFICLSSILWLKGYKPERKISKKFHCTIGNNEKNSYSEIII